MSEKRPTCHSMHTHSQVAMMIAWQFAESIPSHNLPIYLFIYTLSLSCRVTVYLKVLFGNGPISYMMGTKYNLQPVTKQGPLCWAQS